MPANVRALRWFLGQSKARDGRLAFLAGGRKMPAPGCSSPRSGLVDD
jgi:hypothetical protein